MSIISVLFVLIILFGVWNEGLYFEQDFYILSIFVVLLFFSTLVKKRGQFVGYGFILFSLIPLLPLFGGVAFYDVVDGWMYSVTYVLFFLLLLNHKENSIYPFYTVGVVIAVLSLLQPVIENDRIGGVFQYANTLGIVMCSFLLFGLIHYVKENHSLSIIWLVSLFPFVLVALGAESKGALFVFLFFSFLVLVMSQTHEQLRLILMTLFLGIAGSFVVLLQYAWWAVIGMTLFVAGVCYVYERHIRGRWTMSMSKWWIPSLFSGGAAVVIIVLAATNRLASLFKGTAAERMIFLKDGVQLAKDAFWFGHGSDGWARFIYSFQSEPYRTLESHNGFLDLWMNYGIFGLAISFIGIGIVLYSIIRRWRSDMLAPVIFIGMILVHSLIDFNLSYGVVVLLLLWALSFVYEVSQSVERLDRWAKWITYLSSGVIVYFAIRFTVANFQYEGIETASTLTEYEERLTRATTWQPHNPLYAVKYVEYVARIYEETRSDVDYIRMTEAIEKIIQRFSVHPLVHYEVAQVLANVEEREQSLVYLERAIELDPYYTFAYELAIHVAGELVLLAAEREESYEQPLMKVYQYVDEIEQKVENLDHERQSWKFHVNAPMHYSLAVIHLGIKDYEEALRHTEWILQSETKAAQLLKEQTLTIQQMIKTEGSTMKE